MSNILKAAQHMTIERNDEARTELNGELAKFGIEPAKPDTNPKKEEEAEVVVPETTPEVKPEDKSEKHERKPDVKDEKKAERPQKYIPIPQYQNEKKEFQNKIETLEKDLAEARKGNNTEKQVDIEEDIQAEIKAFAEAQGIEDPETLAGLIKLANKSTMKIVEGLKTKVEELSKTKPVEKTTEQIVAEEVARFESEWTPFEKELDKQMPNLTPEQKAEAKKIMDELSHSKEWHKYELDYIFYKNKAEFEDGLGTKTFKGSGPGKTQGITPVKPNQNKAPTLPENPTIADIREYEKHMSGIINTGGLSQKPAERL